MPNNITPNSSIVNSVEAGTKSRNLSKWSIWFFVLLIAIFLLLTLYDDVIEPALQPCGRLDVIFGLSGCFQELETHKILDGIIFSNNTGFTFSEAGSVLVSSSWVEIGSQGRTQSRSNVECWQLSNDNFTQSLEWTTEPVFRIALSLDGKKLAIVTRTHIDLLQEPEGKAWSYEIFAPVKAIDVAFSPDGLFLASIDGEKIQLWNISDHTLLKTYTPKEGEYRGEIAFSPDGEMLAVSGSEGITLLSIPDGNSMGVLSAGADSILFSNDGSLLVSAGDDWPLEISVWGIADRILLHELGGHPNTIMDLAISPDDELLASVSGGHFMLWKLSNGELLRFVEMDAYGVAFISGEAVAVKRRNGSVALYRVFEE